MGTQPDRNWRGYAYDFGLHCSPNGVIEYKSNALDGKLKGKLLVASFVAGQIIVLTISASNPDIVDSMKDDQGQRIVIKGFTGPLDLVENPDNGYLYVAQFDRKTHKGSITLLRPKP